MTRNEEKCVGWRTLGWWIVGMWQLQDTRSRSHPLSSMSPVCWLCLGNSSEVAHFISRLNDSNYAENAA